MNIEIKDGTLKMRVGKYVVYRIDYLLDNLAGEICQLETARQSKITTFEGTFDAENKEEIVQRLCDLFPEFKPKQDKDGGTHDKP